MLGTDFEVVSRACDVQGVRFDYRDDALDMIDCALPLIGLHQARNAALAIRAARSIIPELREETIRSALGGVALPGRFEIVARDPIVVLDVAHNPEKMRAMIAAARATLRWRRLYIVFGALGTKAVAQMLTILGLEHPQIIATVPTVAGRLPSPPEAIADQARVFGLAAEVIADPCEAVQTALAHADGEDVILVTGSLFLVSQVRPLWRPTENGRE
jgi:dihydrofolate synthase/folylpolyglutamate synthase